MGGVGRELQEPLDYEFSNHSKLLVCTSGDESEISQRQNPICLPLNIMNMAYQVLDPAVNKLQKPSR
jgi:hypothetical protein